MYSSRFSDRPRLLFSLSCLWALFSASHSAFGATTLRQATVTSTQAVFAYSTTNTSPCKLEVSERPDYAPLVHDVDPALYKDENLDSRSGSLVSGTTRVVVIGKRLSRIASDTRAYSLALQTNTLHYYRITCGSDTLTGQFTTAN